MSEKNLSLARFAQRQPDPLAWVKHLPEVGTPIQKNLALIDDYFRRAEELDRQAKTYRETAAELRYKLMQHLPSLWEADEILAAQAKAQRLNQSPETPEAT